MSKDTSASLEPKTQLLIMVVTFLCCLTFDTVGMDTLSDGEMTHHHYLLVMAIICFIIRYLPPVLKAGKVDDDHDIDYD